MTFTPETSDALARLRQIARNGKIGMFAQIAADVDALDSAGAFAEIDAKYRTVIRPHGKPVTMNVISSHVRPGEALAKPLVTGYRFRYRDETYTVRGHDASGWDLADSNGETMAVRSTPEQAVIDALADVDQLSSLI